MEKNKEFEMNKRSWRNVGKGSNVKGRENGGIKY